MGESPEERMKLFFFAKPLEDRFPRVENFVEGLGLYVLLLWLTFRLIYVGTSPLEDFLRGLLLLYLVAIGPLLHKNPPDVLGIADPRKIKERLFNRRKPFSILITTMLVILSIFVFPLFIKEFEAVMDLVPLFGELNDLIAASAPLFQVPVAILEYVLFQIIFFFLLVRKDNFKDAFKVMAKPLLVMCGIILLLSLFSGALFSVNFTLFEFLATWYGYTFWALMQQIPFLIYFSTRFRKGLPFVRASDYMSVALLAFYFGFFHGKQWILAILAGTMEVMLAWSFIHKNTRNLFVASLVHGFLGTMIIFFTGFAMMTDFV
ncbi:MAG: hypothetical protein ACTSUE_11680 [Promethearchaeota archaeon]